MNGSLTFVSDRSDNGEFVCSIKNAESTTDIYFKLNVKCKFDIFIFFNYYKYIY